MGRMKTIAGYLDNDGNWIDQHDEPMGEEESAAADAAEVAWADGQAKRDTLAQIAVLEDSITDRRVREAILGTDNGWLKAQNDKITALRKTL